MDTLCFSHRKTVSCATKDTASITREIADPQYVLQRMLSVVEDKQGGNTDRLGAKSLMSQGLVSE